MKILTGSHISGADRFTIENEPISPLDLMERAAEVIAQAICNRVGQDSGLLFFIGKGNNGGDGLAVARILSNAGFSCAVRLLYAEDRLGKECLANLERLPDSVRIVDDGFEIPECDVIVDAILGSGVNGEVNTEVKGIIDEINASPNMVISIDLPSGMKTEFGNDPDNIVDADVTLTLEFPKLAMMLPEAGECCGEIEVLSIDLDPGYIARADTPYNYMTGDLVRSIVRPRAKFSHKGTYGHALLVCGSKGMTGAAVLSTCATLRSGCGLVTVHLPEREAMALYANAPSAMVSGDGGEFFSSLPEGLEKYSALGVGCGIGQAPVTRQALGELLSTYRKPMVIDADALNIIARNPELLSAVPAGSVLTPHPGEFGRLVGQWSDEEQKLGKLRSLAARLNCTVVLKGAHTAICLSDGRIFFNATGSAGMAKGGSGDVLTGFLTGLIARGYDPAEAALMAVWIHGAAGEKAAAYYGVEGMNSSDIIDFLAEAQSELSQTV